MTDTIPTLTLKISEVQPTGEADLQQAFRDAGFEMAEDPADGYNLADLGLGHFNSGLRAAPRTLMELSEDSVTFYQGVYVEPPKVDAEGRTI